MDRQTKLSADMPQTTDSGAQTQPAATGCIDDCLVMLQALGQRVAGLVAPALANGQAATPLTGYQAVRHGVALDECDKALVQLQAIFNQQPGGNEQLELDVADLRITLSKARQAL